MTIIKSYIKHITYIKLISFKMIIICLLFILILTNSCNNFLYAADTLIELNLYSRKVILVDYETGEILYTNGAQDKVYPASTTKILAAILTLEKGNINDILVASQSAINSTPEGSSTANIQIGEVMSVKDVLYCVLMKSANEGANILAEYISGDINSFVNLMNEKVKEIGCKNTHFTNPHGFHDDNHYTTPEDMMTILRYAMKNQDFRDIMETKYYTVGATNKTETPRKLENTNRLLFTQEEMGSLGQYYKYAVGGKTGYTYEAERTFVGYSKKDNKLLLAGTFGAMNIGNLDGRYLDCVTLFEYGFNNFDYNTVAKKDDYKLKFIDKKSGRNYILGISKDITMLVNNNYPNIISYTLDLPSLDNITSAAINQEVGSIKFTILNDTSRLEISKPLILLNNEVTNTIASVKHILLSNNVLSIIRIVALILFIILSIYFLFRILIKYISPSGRYYAKHYNKIKKYLKDEEEIILTKYNKK